VGDGFDGPSKAPTFGASETDGPAPLPARRRGDTPLRRRTDVPGGRAEAAPNQASGRGRGEPPETPTLPRRTRRAEIASGAPDSDTPPSPTGPDLGVLPRRVRQANLAPQLKQDPARRAASPAEVAERDADEVRSRMASLQRGWQRGREENAEGDDARGGTAQGTKGDGR
jgi:hypothetical protein